jgi:trimeric autotransporter adhesin
MGVSASRGVPRMKLLCALVASCFAADGLANPTGPSVVSGTAAFNSVGKALTVTNSPNAIINWQGFSIGAGELTRFQQQSAASAVLNRVVGQDPSAILGTLSSNGKVFLVNPNGILFGLGSRVDVAGLVATTLNITNQDFLAGKLNFQAGAIANAVVNRGEIVTSSGGRVLLLAPDVQNHGLISSPSGEVLLAAGKSVQLVDPDVPQLKVEVQAGGEVLNVGQIFAESGKIGVYAGLIRHSGVARADSVAIGPGGAIQFRASGNVSLEAGSEISARGAERGGTIAVSGDVVLNSGQISADGASGGTIGIAGRNYLGAGSASADGSSGAGGAVSVSVTGGVIATVAERLSARGAQEAGRVAVTAGEKIFSSGTLDATGGRGGTITVLAPQVRLYGATLDASGDTGGGTILVGGDYKGSNPAIANATSTWVNYSTRIRADAGQSGNGGKVIVWADNDTRYGGDISVRGGASSGDGGFVEVSGKNDLVFVGTVNASAPNGTAGSVLLDPKNIVIDAAVSGSVSSFQLMDPNPGTSQQFPDAVAALSNGNVVATDPFDNIVASSAGAVYLFNGTTGALISTLTGSSIDDMVGSGGITTLTGNSNFVVSSPQWTNFGTPIFARGAVSWMSGSSAFSGTVSAANSLIGTTNGDRVGSGGITALANGNYVVSSPNWNNGSIATVGAVTWGNGTSGTSGAVSTANSLVGSTSNDSIGNGGIVALTNGNYVVRSPDWDNGTIAAGVGAVTWASGTGGTTGTVSAANSLVGTIINDQVGGGAGGGVVALTNGNYVVRSPLWNNGISAIDAGAVTWASGTGGTIGAVSTSNSLVGSVTSDRVGSGGVTALNNGNYAVSSPHWSSDRGAATWGNGAGGTAGAVSTANSLVGSTAGDIVSDPLDGGIVPLTNGNFVVVSADWSNSGTVGNGKGAVTWMSGTAASVTGTVSSANSLVGTVSGDRVGLGGVAALTNGNYVVASPEWSNGSLTGVGAVTWGSGTTGVVGPVSTGNSTFGSQSNDFVGDRVTALTNGNYVIESPSWHNGTVVDAGAVTWRSGTVASVGAVSTANSLFGTTSSDRVGSGGVTALTNGNYVVASPNWVSGSLTAVGAVTWASGTTGTSGAVGPGNSLVGSANLDQVGNEGVVALANGNYVVKSGAWSGDKGAVTFGNGATGTTGVVSSTNSLVGSVANDLKICPDNCEVSVVALPGGDYVVRSSNWSNGTTTQVGAVTWGSGTTGVSGTPNATNSLIGSTANDKVGNDGVIAFGAGQFLVSSRNFTQGTATAAGALHVVAPPGTFANPLQFADNAAGTTTISPASIVSLTNNGTAVTLQANNDITLNVSSPITTSASGAGGSITLQAGRSIALSSSITTDNGALTLVANERTANGVVDAQRAAGTAVITMASGTTINAGSAEINVTLNDGAGLTNSTSGAITLGNLTTTGQAVVRNLGPTAGSGIAQQPDSVITANRLVALASNGAVALDNFTSTGAHMINTLAGGATGNFAFRNGQLLTVGTVATSSGTFTGIIVTGGNVSLLADDMSIASPISAGTGTVTLAPLTVSRNINIESSPTAGVLSLTPGEIGSVSAGTLQIGRSDGTGTLSVNAALEMGAFGSLNLYGGDINVSSNITKSSGADASLGLIAKNSIQLLNGADISSTSNKLNVVLNSDADASGAGRIALNPANEIRSNGGNVTLGGGANPLTANAVGDGSSGGAQHGVYLSGASIVSGAGNISIRGTGAAGTTNASGVQLDTSSVVQSTSGSITIVGTGGAGTLGGRNRGIFLSDIGTQITSGNGAITLTGQGGSSTGFAAGPIDGRNRGIDILDGPVISTSGSGNIFLTGTGGSSVDQGQNTGVLLSQSSAIGTSITTVNGNITIVGTGGSTTGASAVSTANRGVSIGASEVRSTGTGSVSITGTGGTTNNNSALSTNSGVLVQGDTVAGIQAFVTTASGSLSLTGTAGSSTAPASHEGILVSNRSTVQSGGSGSLSLTGTAATGNPAILLSGGGGVAAPSTVHVEAGGTLNVTATGGVLKLASAGGTLNNEFVELVSNGNQTINAAGIVLVGGASGSGNYAEIGAAGNQSVTVGSSGISLTGGAGGSGNYARIFTFGNQTVSANGILVQGGASGTSNFGQIFSSGNQTVSASGIQLIGGTGGALGAGNFAQIRSNADQAITVGSGGLALTGGGGAVATNTDNFASVSQSGLAGTSQAITVNGGGSIVLQGGSSAGTPSVNGGSTANIQASGTTQTVNFTSGGTMSLTGGTVGTRNFASMRNANVAGSQTITGATAITLIGGLSGGAEGPDAINTNGNFAQIRGDGNQDITVGAGGITATGGGGSGADNFAQLRQGQLSLLNPATPGTHQTITVTNGGTITLQGGSTSAVATSNGNGSYGRIRGEGDSQTINFTSGGAINITGGTLGTGNVAQIFTSSGTQTITGSPSITLTGGASGGTDGRGNFALIEASVGSQAITASGIVLQGGAAGTDNFAQIRGGAGQSIAVGSGGLSLTGGGGGPTNNDNFASVYQSGLGGTSQTITVGGGGSIVLHGGSSSATGVGSSNGSFAFIRGDGDSQTISFAAGGAIGITGGTVGSSNNAGIYAPNGTQTITGAPVITLTGGASGGVDGEGNSAGIFADTGLQTITSGGMTLQAGAAGITNSAFVQAPVQNITVNGNLVLTGGGSSAGTITGGGAGIGGRGGSGATPTDLALTVHGNITMTGGSVAGSGTAIGSGFVGGQPTDMTITVDGNVTLNPGTVANAESRIGTPASNIAGGDISIAAGGTIALNSTGPGLGTAIRTLGNVTLNAASITQGADSVIVAGGVTTLSGGTVSLTSATNEFGTVVLNTTGNVALTDLNAIDLGTSSTGGASLTVNAGPITQSGPISAGAATFNAGANAITLTNAGNDFTGAVSLNNSGANNVALTDANAIVLGASSVGTGTLTINATGANTITQTGPIVQAPGAGVASFQSGGGAITLTHAANDFTGPLDASAGLAAVAVTDANSLILLGGGGGGTSGDFTYTANGPFSQSGALTGTVGNVVINAGAGPVVLTDAGNNFAATSLAVTTAGAASLVNNNAVNFGTTSIGGAASVTAGGAVTQSGAVTVGGTTTINAGANAILLTNSGNDFTGAVSLNNSGANNVAITDANAIVLGTSPVGSGTLTVNASGAITQTGAITQAAAAGAASFNAGANPITLTNAANDFTGVVNLTGTNVSITDANTLTLGAVNATSLTVNASNIDQNASGVAVSGTTTLNAGTVALTTATNDFGTVVLNTTGNVAITDLNAIDFGTSSTGSGSLAVNASGAITQSGAITAGAATFNAGSNPITLTNASNDFTGAVSLTGTNVSVTDANTLTLGAVSASSLAVNGSTITQNSSGVVVSGTSTLNAGTVTLNAATNDFGTLAVTSPGNVSVTDANAISIGTSSVGGTFDVVAASVSFLNGFSANNYSFSGGSYTLAAGTYNLGGTTTIGASASVTTSGAVNVPGGTFAVFGVLDSGTGTLTTGTVNILSGGLLKGTGTIVGNVNNSAGTVSPGASPGILTISGNYVQGASGTLDMQIGGLVAGTDYDQLLVSGTASLGGTLNTALIGSFVPVPGNTFTFIQAAGGVSGTFTTVNQPAGAFFNNFYGPTTFEFIASTPSTVPVPIAPSFNYAIVSTEQLSLPVIELIETILVSVVPPTTTTTPEGTLVPKPPACN